ncbi:hypothetical protein RB151_030760 [Providencia rettgeri]|nr:hypothetical protein RB151_030760 [Providencia rettgeri]
MGFFMNPLVLFLISMLIGIYCYIKLNKWCIKSNINGFIKYIFLIGISFIGFILTFVMLVLVFNTNKNTENNIPKNSLNNSSKVPVSREVERSIVKGSSEYEKEIFYVAYCYGYSTAVPNNRKMAKFYSEKFDIYFYQVLEQADRNPYQFISWRDGMVKYKNIGIRSYSSNKNKTVDQKMCDTYYDLAGNI